MDISLWWSLFQKCLTVAQADSWLEVCGGDFCLSGDYNGNLSCIDRGTWNDTTNLSNAVHQVCVTLECWMLPAADEGGRAANASQESCHAFSLPFLPSPEVAPVKLDCCSLLFAGLQPHIPCPSLCAHLGLVWFPSLAQSVLSRILCCSDAFPTKAGQGYSSLSICYGKGFKENFVFHLWVWWEPSLLWCPRSLLCYFSLERSHKERRSSQLTITWEP